MKYIQKIEVTLIYLKLDSSHKYNRNFTNNLLIYCKLKCYF